MYTLAGCRVCGSDMTTLLDYENMPKAAQNFPSLEDLNHEKGEYLEVCQCIACGLVQLGNEPVDYYKEVIRASAFSEEMRQFRIDQFKDFVDRYSLQNKNVVEVGCGKGEFLELMRDAGTNAYGLEYSNESVRFCKDKGLDVFETYIEKLSDVLPKHPTDCFFIMNFFEHLPDPNTTLRVLHSNLSDDGIGIVEVPNFDMIVKNNLFSEFINDHLFYFTKETLKSVLERNGFEVVECNEVWHDYIISVVVKKRKLLDLSNFDKHQQKIKNEVQSYISMYDPGEVAIYGAGHQALAVMALADMRDKVKYVVDDATFKQGKYTPATHVPIVSSNSIKNNPPKAIIVMAASYSDEVVRKMLKNHEGIKLAVLRDFGLEIIV